MKHKKILTIFVLMLLSSVIGLSYVSANSNVSYSIYTNVNQLKNNDEFMVTVAGNGIEDAYAFEFHLYYDPRLVEPLIETVHSPIKGVTVPAKVYQNKNGESYVLLAHTQVNSNPKVSGDLTFFNLKFKATAEGVATFNLKYSKLINSAIVTNTSEQNIYHNVQIGNRIEGSKITESTMIVSESQFTTLSNNVVIATPEEVKEIHLPGNTASLLNGKSMTITKDDIVLTFPSGLFTQLMKQSSTSDLVNQSIVIKLEPMTSPSDNQDIIKKIEDFTGAEVTPGSDIYSLHFQVVANGQVIRELETFDYPVTLQLKSSSASFPLTAIYFITEDGEIAYIDSLSENGFVKGKLDHFSKYSVLTVDKTFSDVDVNNWASPVIKELYAQQIVNGTTKTLFSPTQHITRAEFTAMIVRALKLQGVMPLAFNDVKTTDWFYDEVSAATAAGIVTGTAVDKFSPNALITREEMATMISKAYDVKYGERELISEDVFFNDDDQIASWAKSYIYDVAKQGLLKGRPGDLFAPKEKLSRSEAAQAIYNLLNK